MKPLIDGDILRYEIGFACEAGWKEVSDDPEALPPWDYVENTLHMRIDNICAMVAATEKPTIYLTEGRTFRDAIATVKPYKGTRASNKPWHYNNLSVYLRSEYDVKVVDNIEADDAMSIDHIANQDTIICSRDKDLRQVPGWHYSWELGRQPSFGPIDIPQEGWLDFDEEKKKLTGCGEAFFFAQCLMGDAVDNIPGLPKCGPVKAWNILTNGKGVYDPYGFALPGDLMCGAYQDHYGDEWKERLLEQGRLLWMTRRLNEDGTPVLWEIGMEE